jgi:hypothetical protein
VCTDFLAKPAYDHCTENTGFFDALEEDMMFMMSMDMSMKTVNDDDDDTPSDDMPLFDRFCRIFDALTTDKGLECLGIICDDTSAMPSGAPSEEFSAMPSNAPSHVPSDSPSAAPSTAPSASPSALPSSEPSEAPSSVPTLEDVQYIVEVELVSELMLDMATSNVPDLLDETVESSILDALSDFGSGIDVSVLSIAGNELRRRLQNAVPVQFSVQGTEECHSSNCNAFAANLISQLNNALLNVVVDGTLQAYIRQEAVTRDVDALTTVNVIANSYQLIRSDSQLNDPVIVSNPEGVQSAAVMASAVTSLAALSLSFLAFAF